MRKGIFAIASGALTVLYQKVALEYATSVMPNGTQIKHFTAYKFLARCPVRSKETQDIVDLTN